CRRFQQNCAIPRNAHMRHSRRWKGAPPGRPDYNKPHRRGFAHGGARSLALAESDTVLMHRRRALELLLTTSAAASLPALPSLAFAAPPPKNKFDEDNGKGIQFGEPVKQRWRVGMVVR